MGQQPLRVLIYKRTHTGDPDIAGCFGVGCCMGRVRGREFDAVIGVGGTGPKPIEQRIARKITWIGISPQPIDSAMDGYPIWAFEHFYLKDAQGLLLSDKAPLLAGRLFSKNGPRVLMLEPNREIRAILRLARSSPPSVALLRQSSASADCRGRRR